LVSYINNSFFNQNEYLANTYSNFSEIASHLWQKIEENRESWKNDTTGARDGLAMGIATTFAIITAVSLRSIWNEAPAAPGVNNSESPGSGIGGTKKPASPDSPSAARGVNNNSESPGSGTRAVVAVRGNQAPPDSPSAARVLNNSGSPGLGTRAVAAVRGDHGSSVTRPANQRITVSSGSGQRVYLDLSHPSMRTELPNIVIGLRNILRDWKDQSIQVNLPQRAFRPQEAFCIDRNVMLDRLGRISTQLNLENIHPARALISASTQPRLHRDLFFKYCTAHGVPYNYQAAWEDANEGVGLFQKIRKGEAIESTPENIRKICWGMMAHAISKQNGFENGTFVVDDPGFRLFKAFTNCPGIYGRASSHFKTRAIPIPDGLLKGWKHFGLNIRNLPPNMGTVVIGKIQTKDGRERVYIKCEPWGANPSLNTVENVMHFVGHSLDFVISQYRKARGTNQAPGDRKEHMHPEDKNKIQKLIHPFRDIIPGPPPNLKEWGFAEAVPYLREILQLSPDLRLEREKVSVRQYLSELDERYGPGILHRKGNEVQITDSMMQYDPEHLNRAKITQRLCDRGWIRLVKQQFFCKI